MTGFDFAPLFRTAIGFDRLVQLMDTAASAAEVPSYPPYNIEKTGKDTYRLTMAVAGFRLENLEMVVTDSNLVVSGRTSQEEAKSEMLHHGIAGRSFDRRFVLADHVVVDCADLQDGLLHVGLKRVVPDALKPHQITIGTGGGRQAIANDPQSTVQAA
jgi:molecular chaperone IbpA